MKKILMLLGLVSSINAFASANQTNWEINLNSSTRDTGVDGLTVYYKVTAYSGFYPPYQHYILDAEGHLATENLPSYEEEGTVFSDLEDHDKNLIAKLETRQVPYSSGIPSGYDKCIELKADNRHSHICYKLTANQNYSFKVGNEVRGFNISVGSFNTFQSEKNERYGAVSLNIVLQPVANPQGNYLSSCDVLSYTSNLLNAICASKQTPTVRNHPSMLDYKTCQPNTNVNVDDNGNLVCAVPKASTVHKLPSSQLGMQSRFFW